MLRRTSKPHSSKLAAAVAAVVLAACSQGPSTDAKSLFAAGETPSDSTNVSGHATVSVATASTGKTDSAPLPATSAAACKTAADCPASATSCVAPSCSDGKCGIATSSNTTSCTDSSGIVCNGDGTCVQCNQAADCGATGTSCTVAECTGTACGRRHAVAGTSCSDHDGKVCDGSGGCHQCNTNADCGGNLVCDGGSCVGCKAATDCPVQTSTCKRNACSNDTCAIDHAPAGTVCREDGGAVCDGAGSCVECLSNGDCNGGLCDLSTNKCVACINATDCAAQATACKANTCSAEACGTNNAPIGSSCNDSGGTTCDGKGNCVGCNAASDCAKPASACKAAFCTGNGCGVKNVTAGTACTQNGGQVCDGAGTCVACNADADCGANTVCQTSSHTCVGCNTANDCPTQPTLCKINACNSSTCGANNAALGTACTDSGGSVCNATGTCVQCNGDGDCGSGHCSANVCVQCNADNDCPSSCASGRLSAGVCTNHACGLGAASTCAGSASCASATTCNGAACTSNPGCQSPALCNSGACTTTVAAGGSCSANSECTSSICGASGSGNCCTASCPAAVAACGATGCDSSGACIYPGNSTAPAALQTPGDCQDVVCDGSGGDISVNDTQDTPSAIAGSCQTYTCSGATSAPTPSYAPVGTACSSPSDPQANQCADPTGPNAGQCVECTSDAQCYTAFAGICDLGSGMCF